MGKLLSRPGCDTIAGRSDITEAAGKNYIGNSRRHLIVAAAHDGANQLHKAPMPKKTLRLSKR